MLKWIESQLRAAVQGPGSGGNTAGAAAASSAQPGAPELPIRLCSSNEEEAEGSGKQRAAALAAPRARAQRRPSPMQRRCGPPLWG